jgi:hypothetical protein
MEMSLSDFGYVHTRRAWAARLQANAYVSLRRVPRHNALSDAIGIVRAPARHVNDA